MASRVEIIECDSKNKLQKEINERINSRNIKDIKFCISTLYNKVEWYYAMIIYEE